MFLFGSILRFGRGVNYKLRVHGSEFSIFDGLGLKPKDPSYDEKDRGGYYGSVRN